MFYSVTEYTPSLNLDIACGWFDCLTKAQQNVLNKVREIYFPEELKDCSFESLGLIYKTPEIKQRDIPSPIYYIEIFPEKP